MTINSISSAIDQTRQHIAARRKETHKVFSDGVVTLPEMKRLKENFDEAYYDILVLRNMLRQQKEEAGRLSGKERALLDEQISALQQTEKLVFDSYCMSVLSLRRAQKIRKETRARACKDLKVLKVHLSPEELALLYGVIHSAKELKTRGTPEQEKEAEKKIQTVVKLIQNGEKNKKILLEILQAGHSR